MVSYTPMDKKWVVDETCKVTNCTKCSRKLCIKSIPLLSSLTIEECIEVSKGIVKSSVKKGEKIFERGQKANKLFLISSGKVKVFK